MAAVFVMQALHDKHRALKALQQGFAATLFQGLVCWGPCRRDLFVLLPAVGVESNLCEQRAIG